MHILLFLRFGTQTEATGRTAFIESAPFVPSGQWPLMLQLG